MFEVDKAIFSAQDTAMSHEGPEPHIISKPPSLKLKLKLCKYINDSIKVLEYLQTLHLKPETYQMEKNLSLVKL